MHLLCESAGKYTAEKRTAVPDHRSPGTRMRRITLAWAAVLAGQAQAGTCDALPPPSVIVRRIAEPVTLNVEYGYKSLGVLAASLARPGKQVLGLTGATPWSRSRARPCC